MKRYYYIFFLILLVSCNSLKQLQLMKSGKTKQKEFYQIIPFQYKAGIPIIEAEVNGINAYFLFDTGAPNVISLELAEKLNLKTKATGIIEDSGGNKAANQKYISLADLKIGSVNFLNTGAVIQDLNSSDIMSCLKLDGIIGANLMKEAFWKIDYKNQIITLTNDLSKLDLTTEYNPIKFEARISGTPLVNLTINDLEIKNITFDTGSNGHIALPKENYYKLKKEDTISSTFSTGSTKYGVNGKAKSDTTYFAKSKKLKIGDITLNNKIIHFLEYSDTIGTEFLKNFEVILDWKSNTIYLKEITDYDYNSINDYGFKLDLNDNKLSVGELFNQSNSDEKLKIGDQILEINNTDFESLSKADFCELINNKSWGFSKTEKIKMKIKRNNDILFLDIKKTMLIE